MRKGQLIDTNLALTGVVSGGIWSTAWPLANAVTPGDYVGSPARCLDPTNLAASRIEWVADEPVVVSLLALLFHTLSLGARYRITISTLADAAYAAPLLATGWQYVFPSLYDPVDLDFGDENSFAGTVPSTELDLYPRHLFAPLNEVLGQRLRLEIDDQENPAGYFDIGAFWPGAGYSPQINFERGRELTLQARDIEDEAPSGRLFSEERPPRRELAVSWASLSDDEVRRFIDVSMRVRASRPVLFIPDLDDPAGLIREAFPAVLRQLPGGRLSWPGLGASRLTLKEILA